MVLSSTADVALNFRKLRQEFAPSTLKEGKRLSSIKDSCKARLVACTKHSFVIEASVLGSFKDWHTCQLEIDRAESSIIVSHCDCPSQTDCHHLASLLWFLEENFHTLLLEFGGHSDKGDVKLHEAKKRSEKKVAIEKEKVALQEFVDAASLLSTASLLISREESVREAELFINIGPLQAGPRKMTEVSFAVKLPDRPKPVAILQPKLFFQSMILEDPLFLGTTLAVLSFKSFGSGCAPLLDCLKYGIEFIDRTDRAGKAAFIQSELVEHIFIEAVRLKQQGGSRLSLFSDNFEKPYALQTDVLYPEFGLSVMKEPHERLVVRTKVRIGEERVSVRDVKLIRGVFLGCIWGSNVFLLPSTLQPKVKEELETLDTIIIPPELYGSFFSYALPELEKKGVVSMDQEASALSESSYLKIAPKMQITMSLSKGTLSVLPTFMYDDISFPEAKSCSSKAQMSQGMIARSVAQELQMVQRLLWGFTFDPKDGCYRTSSDRKISEFFVETLAPKIKSLKMNIDSSLKSYISLDPSAIQLSVRMKEGGKALCTMRVKGSLQGVPVSKVLEAGRLRRAALEVDLSSSLLSKRYIILGQEKVERLYQAVEELSIPSFDTCEWEVPLWIALAIDEKALCEADIEVEIDEKIETLRRQLSSPIASDEPILLHDDILVKNYQKDGIQWLRRLKNFCLGGILADDMGLGKTPQTIAALSDVHLTDSSVPSSLIICPTSLVENWMVEIRKFQPRLVASPLSGTPQERKKQLEQKSRPHVFIASYGLVQKDLELLSKTPFSYVILDEGQAIKNKETLTARAVKDLQALHRLVLTGTPIENSLDDLWSLFDFLMPGFLGSYDRFVRLYLKAGEGDKGKALEQLKLRISPFVLRRMKHDVLKDLPPITHSVLHCSLSDAQTELYERVAQRARQELQEIVDKEGFDKAKLHVLATLTRLKQICCHPKLIQEEMECSKYELLFGMLSKIQAAKKKAVIFSQYAKMLGLIKQNLEGQGISSVLLDGSTKNRLSLVQKFNEDSSIPFFLVSLRAGGNGLNLVGADTVIHYDIWWNPAVENQATDRVWRMGQKENVHSYKLITKGTIEEKIIELQERKKDLITNVVDSDEDMLSRLTWPDVLELLKT